MCSKDKQARLIAAMMNGDIYDHPADNLQLIETHISWVILAGNYAYKFKKAINLGFLDFSTLAKRQFYCQEELRLNRRLAPEIYLQLVPIGGTPEQPCLNTTDRPVEFAVKMKRFAQSAQLDNMLEQGQLSCQQIDAIAVYIADFHTHTSIADSQTDYGSARQVYAPVLENFKQISERIKNLDYLKHLNRLEQWSHTNFNALQDVLKQRKDHQFIRECHGDLHLHNLAWIHHKPVAFDCIEFNPELRWIDVISDTAFLVMDLDARQQGHFAWRFLNQYLQQNGDYAGLQILRFYLVYRALVRAKVAAIRHSQQDISPTEKQQTEKEFYDYLQLAENYTVKNATALIITHGLSGSGKTTITQPLLEEIGAIRLRSDIERKRLFGLKADDSGASQPDTGIYHPDSTIKTYNKLKQLAETSIDAGYPVIIDATFQQAEQRAAFQQLAMQKNCPYIILDFTAPVEVLRQRIAKRKNDASDATIQVLEKQILNWQALKESEQAFAIHIDSENEPDIPLIIKKIKSQ